MRNTTHLTNWPFISLSVNILRRCIPAGVTAGTCMGLSMASIVIFQGKIYLVDAAPNILHFLEALGISVNEVEGLFHTHTHDDHFAGITTLIRADHRIKYYATPLVRKSVVKKLSALLSWDKDYFDRFLKFMTLNAILGIISMGWR